MGFLGSIFSLFQSKSRHRYGNEPDGDPDSSQRLLSASQTEAVAASYPPAEVTRVALRLRYLVEQVVPCELEPDRITQANSAIVTPKVVHAAKEAGGREHEACVVFCLLVCRRWFKRQALTDLWDEGLFNARAVACEVIAKQIIETEDREEFLLPFGRDAPSSQAVKTSLTVTREETLLRRFSLLLGGKATEPANVVETAVDMHALKVIGTSGYQKCVRYLWWGWLVQDDEDPSSFISYRYRASTNYWIHFDPDRMRAPQYQNWVQMSISIIYLALYTNAINTINRDADIDVVEGILYVFTAGFMMDELTKLWKIGRYYIGFWNAFNSTLYGLLTVSFVLRLVALSHDEGTDDRTSFNILSYNFLAFSAPMFWMRLLLYLDTFKFFGAMLVVLKAMMTESLIFFALLVVICVGFFQGFISLDQIDDNETVTPFILSAMANSVMQSPDFSGFENFAPPFGILLYYIYTFVVMVILLNILVALYNSSYSDVTEESDDEYMALFANKTLQFVRAPDENVFIPPFNLIEIFLLVIPFEWWMAENTYERLNDFVMGVIYTPLMLLIAWLDRRAAFKVIEARRRGETDEDRLEEWERGAQGEDGHATEIDEDWAKTVSTVKPDVATDIAVLEVRELKGKIAELTKAVETLQTKINAGRD